MRTRAMRWRPTSKRLASPDFRSSMAHTRWRSRTREHPRQLVGDCQPEEAKHTRHRHATEHVVEEPHHDHAVGDLGRNSTGLEIEALLLIDRAGGRRMGA